MSEINKNDALNEEFEALVKELIDVANNLSDRFSSLTERYTDLTNEYVANMNECATSMKSAAELNDEKKLMQFRENYLCAQAKAENEVRKFEGAIIILSQLRALKHIAKTLK